LIAASRTSSFAAADSKRPLTLPSNSFWTFAGPAATFNCPMVLASCCVNLITAGRYCFLTICTAAWASMFTCLI